MSSKIPSQANIEKLLIYLPLFERPGRSFVKNWIGGEKTAAGEFTIPYPDYEEDVKAFFKEASQAVWTDAKYASATASKMLEDAQAVGNATIEEARTMLTYCVRGERFCAGHWASVLEAGHIVALLRRLQQIKEAYSAV